MEIDKLVKSKRIIIGKNSVLRNLKLGKVSEVYLAKNCPAKVKDEVKHYDVEVVQLKYPNTELGVLFKKNYSISIVGLKNAKD